MVAEGMPAIEITINSVLQGLGITKVACSRVSGYGEPFWKDCFIRFPCSGNGFPAFRVLRRPEPAGFPALRAEPRLLPVVRGERFCGLGAFLAAFGPRTRRGECGLSLSRRVQLDLAKSGAGSEQR